MPNPFPLRDDAEGRLWIEFCSVVKSTAPMQSVDSFLHFVVLISLILVRPLLLICLTQALGTTHRAGTGSVHCGCPPIHPLSLFRFLYAPIHCGCSAAASPQGSSHLGLLPPTLSRICKAQETDFPSSLCLCCWRGGSVTIMEQVHIREA